MHFVFIDYNMDFNEKKAAPRDLMQWIKTFPRDAKSLQKLLKATLLRLSKPTYVMEGFIFFAVTTEWIHDNFVMSIFMWLIVK